MGRFGGFLGDTEYLVDVERGATKINFSSSVVGFPPLNHNKQKCKMFPNNHDYKPHAAKANMFAQDCSL